MCDIETDLETMGLVDTWIESRGREGCIKQVPPAFDPQWVRVCAGRYLEATVQADPAAILGAEGEE